MTIIRTDSRQSSMQREEQCVCVAKNADLVVLSLYAAVVSTTFRVAVIGNSHWMSTGFKSLFLLSGSNKLFEFNNKSVPDC